MKIVTTGITRSALLKMKRRKHSLRLLTAGLLILLSLGATSIGIAGAFQSDSTSTAAIPPTDQDVPDGSFPARVPPTPPQRFSILVMGVDQRPGDIGRSDTMILASAGEQGEPVAVSIPRDTRANIPGHGLDKVNHAYAYGGPELSAGTVSNLLGTSIDGYVVINLDAFKRIINALGGVTLDVEKRMYYVDEAQDLIIDLQPGQQRLDGDKAMQYIRYRSDGMGDLGRVERQQKFLKALAQEAMSPTNVLRLPAIVKEVSGSVQTNLSISDALRMLATTVKTCNNGIKGVSVPGHAEYIDGISYYIPDQDALQAMIPELQNQQ